MDLRNVVGPRYHSHSPSGSHLSLNGEHHQPQSALYRVQPPQHLHDPLASHRYPPNPFNLPNSSAYPIDQRSLDHPGLRNLSSTCVPALIPPGMDPAHVDMRTFFPYQPNEVKHRKRTTRQQLKVLEDVYKYDTKPNAMLRKKLAEELGMTPRGVQVWFQNRRAKTKTQARKADIGLKKASSTGGASTSPDSSSPDVTSSSLPTLSSSDGLIPDRETSVDDTASVSSGSKTITGDLTSDDSCADLTSDMDMSIWTQPNPFGTPPSSSSLPSTPEDVATTNTHLSVPDKHLRNQRRPSLPIIVSPPSLDVRNQNLLSQRASFDASIRRGSMDNNAIRLRGHPYAHLAHHLNQNIYVASGIPPNSLATPGGDGSMLPGRMGIRHGSMPHVFGNSAATTIAEEGQLPQQPYYLSPNQHLRRPGFPQRLSMPSVMQHQLPHQQHPQQPQAQHRYPLGPPLQMSVTDARLTQQQQQQAGYPFPMCDSLGPSSSALQHQQHNGPDSPIESSPPPNISQYQLLQQRPYMIPSREVPAPIPGPLPAPNFSFGNPQSSSSSPPNGSRSGSGSSSGGSLSPSMMPNGILDVSASADVTTITNNDPDTEDDVSAVSSTYDPLSRFGSFASIGGGSESSFTSGYYSEVGSGVGSGGGGECGMGEDGTGVPPPNGFDPDLRRASCASGHFLEMFSDLEVSGGQNSGGHTPQALASTASSPNGGGSLQDDLTGGGTNVPLSTELHHQHQHQHHSMDGDAFSSPSSTSTISAGTLHGHGQGQAPGSGADMGSPLGPPLMLAQSSELAYALTGSGEQNVVGLGIGVNVQTANSGTNVDDSQLMYSSEYPDPDGMGSLGGGRSSSSDTDLSKGSLHAYPGAFNLNGTFSHEVPPEHQLPHPHPHPLSHHPHHQQHNSNDNDSYMTSTVAASASSHLGYGGMGPIYGTGAIELGNMCVPASMGAMDGFQGVDPYMPYS